MYLDSTLSEIVPLELLALDIGMPAWPNKKSGGFPSFRDPKLARLLLLPPTFSAESFVFPCQQPSNVYAPRSKFAQLLSYQVPVSVCVIFTAVEAEHHSKRDAGGIEEARVYFGVASWNESANNVPLSIVSKGSSNLYVACPMMCIGGFSSAFERDTCNTHVYPLSRLHGLHFHFIRFQATFRKFCLLCFVHSSSFHPAFQRCLATVKHFIPTLIACF